jgi:probable rRNA maturation factor
LSPALIKMPPARLKTELSDDDAAEPSHSRFRVEIANETDAEIDADRLTAIVCNVLAKSDCSSAVVSIAIVDDPTIHRLNRQFLEHDYATDVLSFTLAEPPDLEGEIIASIDTARREAAVIGWSPDDELALYAAHGILHLVGYLDKDAADAAEMRAAERATLAAVGIYVSPNDPRWLATPAADSDREAPQS